MMLYHFCVWVQDLEFDVHVTAPSRVGAWKAVRELFPKEGLDVILLPA